MTAIFPYFLALTVCLVNLFSFLDPFRSLWILMEYNMIGSQVREPDNDSDLELENKDDK